MSICTVCASDEHTKRWEPTVRQEFIATDSTTNHNPVGFFVCIRQLSRLEQLKVHQSCLHIYRHPTTQILLCVQCRYYRLLYFPDYKSHFLDYVNYEENYYIRHTHYKLLIPVVTLSVRHTDTTANNNIYFYSFYTCTLHQVSLIGLHHHTTLNLISIILCSSHPYHLNLPFLVTSRNN